MSSDLSFSRPSRQHISLEMLPYYRTRWEFTHRTSANIRSDIIAQDHVPHGRSVQCRSASEVLLCKPKWRPEQPWPSPRPAVCSDFAFSFPDKIPGCMSTVYSRQHATLLPLPAFEVLKWALERVVIGPSRKLTTHELLMHRSLNA